MHAVLPREHYATLEHATYLNQASLGLIPRPSINHMTTFLSDVAQHGNAYLSDEQETAVLEDLRASGARILGAPIEAVAIVGGASEGLNQAASLLASPDGEVILVSTDFPCVTSPWLNAEQRLGMNIRWVDDLADGDLTASIIDAISPTTTVVCVSSVHYATGTKLDVAAVTGRAHEVGATVVVDVTQMAGALPVSMNDWQADVLVCSGYKWLSGHGGAALLAMSEPLIGRMPQIVGWMGTVAPFDFNATRLRPAGDARRFQLSTMAYSSAVGLTASLDLLERTGIDVIERHAAHLSDELLAEVAPFGWLPFHRPSSANTARHITSLRHPDHDAGHVQRFLADIHNVHVSSRGARLRVSLHGYNDRSDVEALATGLKGYA